MKEESRIYEQSTRSMEHVLIPRHTASKHNMKNIGCRPGKCRIRKLTTNKGAIYLILLWNFLIMSATINVIFSQIDLLIVSLTLPFAGWLADIRFGRYKVIRWSMWIMWIGSMLATITSVVAQFVDNNNYQYINKHISLAFEIVICIGCGGYQANAVLFGLDQLQDASTDEITAFIINMVCLGSQQWCSCFWISQFFSKYRLSTSCAALGMLLSQYCCESNCM